MELSSTLLKSMIAAAPKESDRSYLNGVHVANGVIEVTNGHYLFMTDVDTGDESRRFTLIGDIPDDSIITKLNFDKEVATHYDYRNSIVGISHINQLDGKYPDCSKLVKSFEAVDVESVSFSSEYAGLPFTLFGASCITLEFGGQKGMAKATFMTYELKEVEMYLMPMRA